MNVSYHSSGWLTTASDSINIFTMISESSACTSRQDPVHADLDPDT